MDRVYKPDELGEVEERKRKMKYTATMEQQMKKGSMMKRR